MKKIFLTLLILLISINNVLASGKIPAPTGLKLVKEVIDPNQGPTRVTFSYDLKENIDRYQIYYGKKIGEYNKDSRVLHSSPVDFLIDGKKGETYYFVIKAKNIGVDSGESDYSTPIKVVIGGEHNTTVKENNTNTTNKNNGVKLENPLYLKSNNLPVTGPENILLILFSLFTGFIYLKKTKNRN